MFATYFHELESDLIENRTNEYAKRRLLTKDPSMKTSFDGVWGWDSLDMPPYKDASFHLRSSLYIACMQACDIDIILSIFW